MYTAWQRYGIDVFKPLDQHRLPLYRELRKRVFYVYNNMPPKSRERYTMDPCDYPQDEARVSIPLWLFWKPHLSQLVDLEARHADYRGRQEAAQAIADRFKRAFAAVLRRAYEDKSRARQTKWVTLLQRNEVRRRQGPPKYADPCERYEYAARGQELRDHADKMPEPFEPAVARPAPQAVVVLD